jgi:hypothetical protein
MGLQADSTGPAPAKRLSEPRCCVAHAWLTRNVFRQLEREAKSRGMHPDALVAAIVAGALTGDMSAFRDVDPVFGQ